MSVKKILKFISNSFNFTINCVFKSTKFIIKHIFTIYQFIEHYYEGWAFNFYDFIASFTLPSMLISIIMHSINILRIVTHKKELDQNKEIVKYVPLFLERFTFINNFILLIIVISNIYLIKNSHTYMYFFN